jgi:undecaprenyl-diphosphatase
MWWETADRVTMLLGALVVLAWQVSVHGPPTALDRVVTAWLVAHRSPELDGVALGVTNVFGPAETVIAAVVLAVVVAVGQRRLFSGLIVVATVGGASAACWLVKLLIARPRPPVEIQRTLEVDYSFPSGHVTGTTALMGMVLVAVSLSAGCALTKWIGGLAVAVVLMVAVSRLYLGVHWLSDVVAGILLGAAAVVAATTALGRPLTR